MQEISGWGLGGGGNRELLFSEYRLEAFQDEKSPGGWLHNSGTVYNTTERYTQNWLGW